MYSLSWSFSTNPISLFQGLKVTWVAWVLQDLQVALATLADQAFQDQKV